MREKNVSAKGAVRLELPQVKVATVVEVTGSEQMEKSAQAVMKKLAIAASHSRYDALMIVAMAKMFAANVLDADQAEIDRTILAIRQGATDKPVN